jgi:hypothetical protein
MTRMSRILRRSRDHSTGCCQELMTGTAADAMRSVSAVVGVAKSSSLLHLRNQKQEPPIYDRTMKSFLGGQLHVRFCLHQLFA